MADPTTPPEPQLLDGMTPQQIAELESLADRKTVSAGQTILREGERSTQFFLIRKGEVRIVKEELGVEVARLGAGDNFGVMAAIDRAPRSASAIATTEVDLLVFTVEDLEVLSKGAGETAYAKLLGNALRIQNRQLRSTTEARVDALERELAESKAREGLAAFLTNVVAIMCAYGACLRIGLWLAARGWPSAPFTVAILVFYVAVLGIMVKRSGQPLAVYGVTVSGWKGHVREALVWSALFLLAVTLLKGIAIHVVPSWRTARLFDWPGWSGMSGATAAALLAVYVLFVPMQEFVARGALQGSMQVYLPGKQAPLKANLVANLMFSATHLHLSPAFAAAVFAPGLLWGVLFARQRSLVGPTVSHVLIGLYVVFLLGLPGMT